MKRITNAIDDAIEMFGSIGAIGLCIAYIVVLLGLVVWLVVHAWMVVI
ncbi:hypothetical protein [Lactiplantibacillus paraxiangfangensis]